MRSSDGLPTVAIVGRPNVGKSTLFNRILRRRLAVVHDEAGVTRDRNYARASFDERSFWLVDTGGFGRAESSMEVAVREQVDAAIEEADLVLLLLDAGVGVAPEDEDVIRALLRSGKPTLVAANKADDEAKSVQAGAIVAGGLGVAIPVAAESGRGVGDLLEEIVKALPPEVPIPDRPEDDPVTYIAIVGRPNVGKSSLVNAILGQPKMVVSAEAGTTRDSVDTPLEVDGKRYVLVDTAGLRRPGRRKRGVESWSALRTVRALERCDIAVVVLDASEPVSEQDVRVAAEATDRYKGVVLVANKWDAAEKDPDVARRYEDRLAFHFKFLEDAPLVYASALTGRRIDRILPEAAVLAERRRHRVPTAAVNELLRRLVEENPPPSNRSKLITRVFYATQVSTRPPTFAVFSNRPENLESHWVRFLRNRFREELGFRGLPVKVVLRRREPGDRDEDGPRGAPARGGKRKKERK